MTLTTTCRRCKCEKPPTEFHRSTKRKSGLQPWCKTCTAAAYALWYATNREAKKRRASEYFHEKQCIKHRADAEKLAAFKAETPS